MPRIASGLLLGAVVLLSACAGAEPAGAPSNRAASAASGRPGSTFVSSGGPASATAAPSAPSTSGRPPYIRSATWVTLRSGSSLQVAPTAAGRTAQGEVAMDAAWREVLGLRPDADTPGMREQFDCHWLYARLIQPEKATWNLEPWRPVVSASAMIAAGCNPGGPE